MYIKRDSPDGAGTWVSNTSGGFLRSDLRSTGIPFLDIWIYLNRRPRETRSNFPTEVVAKVVAKESERPAKCDASRRSRSYCWKRCRTRDT